MDGVLARSTVRGNADPRCESFGLVIPREWYRDMDNDAAVQPHVLLAELGVESDWSGDHGVGGTSPTCQEQGAKPSAPCGASSDGVNPTLSPAGGEFLQQRTEKEKQQLREVSFSSLSFVQPRLFHGRNAPPPPPRCCQRTRSSLHAVQSLTPPTRVQWRGDGRPNCDTPCLPVSVAVETQQQ